jgi:hypothetical protein
MRIIQILKAGVALLALAIPQHDAATQAVVTMRVIPEGRYRPLYAAPHHE